MQNQLTGKDEEGVNIGFKTLITRKAGQSGDGERSETVEEGGSSDFECIAS